MERKLFVNTKDESPRMFESDFLDFFSRIPYWVPPIIFVPVIVFFAVKSLGFFEGVNVGVGATIGVFLAGLLFWSIAEYIIHRFVFHFHPKSETMKRLHFLFHGVHHDYPQDSLRLVMPPAVSISLAFIFYGLFYLVIGLVLGTPQYIPAFFSGFVAGYLFYDMMHYASHHVNMKNKYFQMIKEHHMKHHYKEPDAGFGFTSKIWDRVFKTDFPEEDRK